MQEFLAALCHALLVKARRHLKSALKITKLLSIRAAKCQTPSVNTSVTQSKWVIPIQSKFRSVGASHLNARVGANFSR